MSTISNHYSQFYAGTEQLKSFGKREYKIVFQDAVTAFFGRLLHMHL